MCDYSGNWVAWLDRELPPEEAGEGERHLEECSECRIRVEAYRRAIVEFDDFRDQVIASSLRRKKRPWMPAAAVASAAVALVSLLMVMSRTRANPPVPRPAISVSTASAGEAPPVQVPLARNIRHRQGPVVHTASPVANPESARGQDIYPAPYEPVIRISIPADEIFPPGAVPDGLHFAADITIAADGSADRLRLQPRLTGF